MGAFSAALFYGAATVLQAVGVRRVAALPEGCRMVRRLWAARLFAVGLLLDAAGFLASLVALRTLPLFLVQSVIASSVGVTVVLAIVFLGARLRAGEVLALVVIGAGLVALAASASTTESVALRPLLGWLLLICVVPLALLAGVGAVRVGAIGTTALVARFRILSRSRPRSHSWPWVPASASAGSASRRESSPSRTRGGRALGTRWCGP